ncbi:MAG: hypothetical protein QW199_01930 [Candidatus Pacearchaeota archaeon]
MPKRYISEEQFKKIITALGIEYLGVTKAGEPRLRYGKKEFTVSRKTDEGYKLDVVRKILDNVKIEKAVEERKSPGEVYHALVKQIKEIVGADF